MTRSTRNRFGILLAALGLVVCGVELTLYWVRSHPIHPAPMIVAAVLFFVGGAIIDTVKALQISNAVVTGAGTVINALPLPFGRRATDKIANAGGTVVIPPTGEHAAPTPAPTPTPPAQMESQ